MNRVLITGGTGVLGRRLEARLTRAGSCVRIMSRRPRPGGVDPEAWAVADLASGAGLADAVRGVHTVVHAATSPYRRTRSVDVAGTRRLLDACEAANVKHLLYVSIVGIERIPFPYFRHKLAAERLIAEAEVPWSVLRATQFHELLDMQIGWVARMPLLILPSDLRFQLLDSGEAADCVVEALDHGPGGRLPDVGGPLVQTSGEIVAEWLAARGLDRRVWSLPSWGRLLRAYRSGYNCVPERALGTVTWSQWLARRYRPSRSECPLAHRTMRECSSD